MAILERPLPSSLQTSPLSISYEAFLDWALQEAVHAEWVNGKVYLPMSATPLHQDVIGFLASLLRAFVEWTGLGKIYTGPMQMKLPSAGREPDVFFVAREHLGRVLDNRLDGPADVVIEIISDDSVTRDREDKFYEYEAAGIPEYWIIDPRPNRRRAYFYQLNAQGQYQPMALDAEERYHSRALPGFWLKPHWLWQDNLPDHLLAMADILGAERLIEFIRRGQPAPN